MGSVDVVGPVGPVGTVDEPVVEPVVEVVELLPAVVVGRLEELEGRDGAGAGHYLGLGGARSNRL